MSDGITRFGIELSINDHLVRAGLDTGSSGLAVLPPWAPEAKRKNARVAIGFGSGIALAGTIEDANVAIGTFRDRFHVESIDRVVCIRRAGRRLNSACRRFSNNLAGYKIFGDGFKNEGFEALLGIKLISTDPPNPLVALGIRRWIVRLPEWSSTDRRGDLTLDPIDDDVAGFTTLRPDSDPGSVRGCLSVKNGSSSVCGPVMIDSGSTGITIVNPGGFRAPAGSVADLRLATAHGPDLVEPLRIGATPQTRLRYVRGPHHGPVLRTGRLLFGRYEILFDSASKRLAVRTKTP